MHEISALRSELHEKDSIIQDLNVRLRQKLTWCTPDDHLDPGTLHGQGDSLQRLEEAHADNNPSESSSSVPGSADVDEEEDADEDSSASEPDEDHHFLLFQVKDA